MLKRSDKRAYARVATDVHIRYREQVVSKAVRDYFDGVAANISLGGLFIATSSPAAVGTVIELELETEGDHQLEVVRCKAVVRWRQRWRKPAGMGVQLIELDGLGCQTFESWFSRIQQ